MNINNVISPAQARLAFCRKDYVRILSDINQAITEASREERKVQHTWTDVEEHVFHRAAQDLRNHGFSVQQWIEPQDNHKENDTYHIVVSW